jgi:FAD-dependent urate hydroxylase
MHTPVPLLVIGAGPFGLAVASHAALHGIDCIVVGEPMAFWKHHMPDGMLLRSTCGWHLDPAAAFTIDEYLATSGQSCTDVEPLSRDFYLRYASWFLTQTAIRPLPTRVRRLDRDDHGYVATLDMGSAVRARNVVIAAGLRYFAHSPEDITSVLPAGAFAHTCECVDLARFRGHRCLLVGGRQSAFEWAALLGEAGADTVHICYRHDTPAFVQSDWEWVDPLVERTRTDPGWYRRLTEQEKQAITRRMWQNGRAQLEPWLRARIDHDAVHLWPRTRVTGCVRSDNGDLRVSLDSGTVLAVDQIILATGYRVDVQRIPFVRDGNLWPTLRVRDGYPELDERLQSNHNGLFFTGQVAVQDFGPFFGFTVAARVSAELICQAVARISN